jgi:hypothetical protein
MSEITTKEEVFTWLYNSLTKNDKKAETVIYGLMLADVLSIAKLVKMKEDALHERYDELKGDASEICAVALLYKEKLFDIKDKKGNIIQNPKEELDERYVKAMTKLGFIKPVLP